jgi:hypothetical protein
MLTGKGFTKLVIRTKGICYPCQQLAYLGLCRIFLIARNIGDKLRSYQEYPAKLVGKQGKEFLIAALVKR